MGTAVALPGRQFAEDHRRDWPPPLERGGIVAAPSRAAALTGQGFPDMPGRVPPLDGTGGPVLGVSAWRGGVDQGSPVYPGSGQRWGMPRGRIALHFVRQFFDNIAGLAGYAIADATTNTTRNASPANDDGAARSPIPYDRKWIIETFGPDFDQRLWADYVPRENIQVSAAYRRFRAGTARMDDPYFPALTRLQSAQGTPAQVLTPASSGSTNSGTSPYATR